MLFPKLDDIKMYKPAFFTAFPSHFVALPGKDERFPFFNGTVRGSRDIAGGK